MSNTNHQSDNARTQRLAVTPQSVTSPHGDKLGRFIAPQHRARDLGAMLRNLAEPDVTAYHISMAIDCSQALAAQLVQEGIENVPNAPRDCGLSFGFGCGDWGVEPCMHITTSTRRDITAFIVLLLNLMNQECAYVCVDGWANLECNAHGVWSPITGEDDS